MFLPLAADLDGGGAEDIAAAVMDRPPVARTGIVVARSISGAAIPGDVDLADLAIVLVDSAASAEAALAMRTKMAIPT